MNVEFDLENCLAWPILLLYLSKMSLLTHHYTMRLGKYFVHRPLYDHRNAFDPVPYKMVTKMAFDSFKCEYYHELTLY